MGGRFAGRAARRRALVEAVVEHAGEFVVLTTPSDSSERWVLRSGDVEGTAATGRVRLRLRPRAVALRLDAVLADAFERFEPEIRGMRPVCSNPEHDTDPDLGCYPTEAEAEAAADAHERDTGHTEIMLVWC